VELVDVRGHMLPSIENDKFFLELIEKEELFVSNLGDVLDLNTGKQIGFITGGYKRINMYGKTMAVHRLVYLVHISENIPEFLAIDHLDGNKLNNKVENLEAVSYSENNKRAVSKGLHKIDIARLKEISKGSKNGMAKLNCEEVKEIRALREKGFKVKDIAELYHVLPKAISQLLNGVTYKDC
jgi:hypothetical protein